MPSNLPNRSRVALAAASVLCALYPLGAQAYVGPGAGLTAIGTMVALLAALLLAIVGFVWYPIKRLMKKPDAAPEIEGPRHESR